MWEAAAISAGASLLGGFMDRSAARDINSGQMDLAHQNLAMQREMAQNGIRWRVEDAKRSGIHPLYAMGAQLPSFSPVFTGGTANSSLGDSFAAAGQDISRAMSAGKTGTERVTDRITELQLEKLGLENDLLRSRIARENSAQLGPPMPGALGMEATAPVTAQTMVTDNAMERTRVNPAYPAQEPAAIPDVGYARTPTGLAPVPSDDVKQRIEDQLIPELMWSLRNNIKPSIGMGEPPPKHMLPEGASSWEWSITNQEWRPVFGRGDSTVWEDLRNLPDPFTPWVQGMWRKYAPKRPRTSWEMYRREGR